MVQTVRFEVNRDRLVSTILAQKRMGSPYSIGIDKEMPEAKREELQAERQADDLSAILACIRLVIE